MRRREGAARRARDTVAVEEPLEIRVAWTEPGGARAVEPLAVTMRTPGDDFELVAGFLLSEGVVNAPGQLAALSYCSDEAGGAGSGDRAAVDGRPGSLAEGSRDYNVVEARLASGASFDLESLRRHVYATSACGVCGKASLDAIEARGCRVLPGGLAVDAALLPALPDRLLEAQGVFARTGGLHAAGLFDAEGAPLVVREDVGRHNAVDKVLGRAFLDGAVPAADRILVVSGRASFELVQKAVVAGVPVLVAVGAPSSLAVDLAQRFDQTLVGFARDGGCNVYAGERRVGDSARRGESGAR